MEEYIRKEKKKNITSMKEIFTVPFVLGEIKEDINIITNTFIIVPKKK